MECFSVSRGSISWSTWILFMPYEEGLSVDKLRCWILNGNFVATGSVWIIIMYLAGVRRKGGAIFCSVSLYWTTGYSHPWRYFLLVREERWGYFLWRLVTGGRILCQGWWVTVETFPVVWLECCLTWCVRGAKNGGRIFCTYKVYVDGFSAWIDGIGRRAFLFM